MPLLSKSLHTQTDTDYYYTGVCNLDEELGTLHAQRSKGYKIAHTRSAGTQASQSSSTSSQISTQNSPSSPASSQGIHASGLPAHSLTEVSGLPGVGKTALWLAIAVDVLSKGKRICYVSCRHARFPLERARLLHEWDAQRFEKNIQTYTVSKVEQLLALQQYLRADVALVLFDGYDSLVNPDWSRELKSAAAEVIIQEIASISKQSCVIATSRCIPYNTMGRDILLAPAFRLSPTKQPLNMVRVLIYKDADRDCQVLSSGAAFRISGSGQLAGVDDSNRYSPIPLAVLTSRRRPTSDSERPTLSSPRESKRVGRDPQFTPVGDLKRLISPVSESKTSQYGCSLPKRQARNTLYPEGEFSRVSLLGAEAQPSFTERLNAEAQKSGIMCDTKKNAHMCGMQKSTQSRLFERTTSTMGVNFVPNSQIEECDTDSEHF